MYSKHLVIMLAVVLLASIASCSTMNAGGLSTPDRGASRFALNVWGDSYIDGASANGYTLNVEDKGNSILVDVNVSGAKNLKALYFDLSYDPQTYRPLVVEPTNAMGSKADLLNMEIVKERGKVYYGQVLTNYQWRPGLSGDATVAQVMFVKEQFHNFRTVSAAGPPVATRSQTTLNWDGTTLTWFYYNNGDYDQNGQANISDLTPLGANFGQTVTPALFPENSNLSAIDGDNNGSLNISDITPIGASFQASALGGYNIYYSLDTADAGAAPGDPNGAGATLVTNVVFGDATGNPASDRKAFSNAPAAPPADGYYWVRPTDGTADGIRSNLVPLNLADVPALSLTNPPASGLGTFASPYIADTSTDYIFSLIDPTDGDVSTNAATNWTVTPSGAGPDPDGTATLNVDDAFTGDFTVSATYNGIGSNPTSIFMRIPGVGPGGLEINPDPADGDWPGQSAADPGTGHDFPYYVLSNVYTTEYTFVADDTSTDPPAVDGTPIDVSTLEWHAFPAEWLVEWTIPGTFRANTFTNCYIFALDGASTESNHVYVEVHDLPAA